MGRGNSVEKCCWNFFAGNIWDTEIYIITILYIFFDSRHDYEGSTPVSGQYEFTNENVKGVLLASNKTVKVLFIGSVQRNVSG